MMLSLFAPFEELALKLKRFLPHEGDGAHDLSHLHRVWGNAKTIQKEEGGDAETLAAAVLLHDCVQVPKDSPLRSRAAGLAAEQARIALTLIEWQEDKIETVAQAIESHSYSAGVSPSSLEGRILQDADRLDAIGYIGIARCFYTGGRMGSSLYDLSEPEAMIRMLDDRHFALDHFPKKLLKLAEGFQTGTGAILAQQRQQTLEDFYRGFLNEVGN
jgi:uncharacterized protein